MGKLLDNPNLNHELVDWSGEGGDFYLYPYLTDQVENKKESNGDSLDLVETENLIGQSKSVTNNYVIIKPIYNSAVIFDGAQVIHGVDRYRPDDLPPLFAGNHHYTIRYDQYSNMWNLYDFMNNPLRSYDKNEVKLMVNWNMHCFANQTQKEKFHSEPKSYKMLTLKKIINTFKKDLKQRNKLPDDEIEPIDLWTIALKEYLNYPVNTQSQNTTIFGINYCLLPNIMPEWFTKHVLNIFLNYVC